MRPERNREGWDQHGRTQKAEVRLCPMTSVFHGQCEHLMNHVGPHKNEDGFEWNSNTGNFGCGYEKNGWKCDRKKDHDGAHDLLGTHTAKGRAANGGDLTWKTQGSDRCRHVFVGSSGDQYQCSGLQGHRAEKKYQHTAGMFAWFDGDDQETVLPMRPQPVPDLTARERERFLKAKSRSAAAKKVFGG